MTTSKRALTLAAITLAISTAAPAQEAARNFTASSQYWVWIDSMKIAAGLAMPEQAYAERRNPLHPAYYAARVDKEPRTDGAPILLSEIRNPLHPQYYVR